MPDKNKSKKVVTKTITTTVTTEENVAPVTMLISMVADMSGSMALVYEQTLSGMNEYIQGHKNIEDCDFSFTKFDNIVETPIVAQPISEVSPITKEMYCPRGATALRDAVGSSILSVEGLPKKYDKVLMIIFTDGHENASVEFSHTKLNTLVSKKRDEGWEFIFVGAHQDAWTTGASMGFNNNYQYNATTTGTKNLFGELTRSSVNYVSSMSSSVAPNGRRSVSSNSVDSSFSSLNNLVNENDVIDNNTNT